MNELKNELMFMLYVLDKFWKLFKKQEIKSAFKIMKQNCSTKVSWKHIYIADKHQGMERTLK